MQYNIAGQIIFMRVGNLKIRFSREMIFNLVRLTIDFFSLTSFH